jgi:hypothetical protein
MENKTPNTHQDKQNKKYLAKHLLDLSSDDIRFDKRADSEEHKGKYQNYQSNPESPYDNYKETGFLDAIASMFYCDRFVSKKKVKAIAVYKNDKGLNIVYHKNPKSETQKKMLELVKKAIPTNELEKIFLVHLFNYDLMNSLKSCKVTDVSTIIKPGEKLKKEIKKYKLHELLSNFDEKSQKIKSLFDEYFNLLTSDGFKQLKLHDKELLFRPLQDACKIYYIINDNATNFNIVDKSYTEKFLHADVKAADYVLKEDDQKEKYIGVSKLCCGGCNAYLVKKGFGFRGSHFTIDKNWFKGVLTNYKENDLIENSVEEAMKEDMIEKSLQIIDEPEGMSDAFRSQDRKLSWDSIEEKIHIGTIIGDADGLGI